MTDETKVQAPRAPLAPDELHRMTLEALEDVDAGRLIDHQAIQAWSDSLGGP